MKTPPLDPGRAAVTVAHRIGRASPPRCPGCGRVGTLHLVMTAGGERRACVGTNGTPSCGYYGPHRHRYVRRNGREEVR